jgi:predicted Zn-dependent peptidase
MSIDFRQQTLPNGLTVIAECDPDAHTSAVGFYVKTGARDESAELMGVSHFLEHMMFKGTARRTADDVNREFDEMGANYNAFTSHEMTVYYAAVLPEFLPRAVDLLGDMLRPALRDDDFGMERNVILEEIGMYEDRPTWRLQDAMVANHFRNHSLGFRVLGTTDTIRTMTAAQMRGYFEQRYSADNITVAAAGRIDFARLLDDVATATQSWRPTRAARTYQTPAHVACEVNMPDDKVTRHYVGLMCTAPSAQDELRYAARVLADIIGDDEGSRLYWSLIDPGLADEADFSFSPADQAGSFVGFASCDPKRAAEVEQRLTAAIDGVAGTIDPDEIVRVKNKLATSATLQGENPRGRMHLLGSQWTYLGRYAPLEEELQRLMAVTPEDMAALLAAHPLSPRTTVRLGPGLR